MGLIEAAERFLGLTLIDRPAMTLSTAAEDAIDKILHARENPRSGFYRLPSVAEALGVPSIQRAVSLISSTVGMLSVQGFRNGELMPTPPQLIARPDPDQTPYEFYSMTAAQSAKYGEFVWWIASRDSDNLATALVNVPLNELQVQDNSDNRRFPKYRWGKVESTRYSPANPSGQFVHKKYPIGEPYALRGEGPLQLGQIAISISVEAQIWAANFYGGGGHASDIIKHAAILDPTLRDDFDNPDPVNGLSEADRLKAQYIARDGNTPMVIDQNIESITDSPIDPTGAQMLEARLHQNGDAARLFGLPGKFVEYVQSGTSLTYQTLESAFTDLVKTCLQPLYLEPIEQALSDLLTRSTSARFNVKGFLRADIKTRFEVHGIAIDKGIYGPDYAQREEGILPGDVEFAPVPFAPPQAIPATIPRWASLVADWRCSSCGLKLLEQAGPGSIATCRRCKTRNELARGDIPEPAPPTVTVNFPERMVVVESPVTVHPPDIHVEPTINLPERMVVVESPVTVHQPDIHIEPTFNAPEPAPLTLNVAIPQTEMSVATMADKVATMSAVVEDVRKDLADRSAQLDDRLDEVAARQTELAAKVTAPRKPRRFVPERNAEGQIVGVTEAA
jgi:phage portal protein BeeE